MSVDVGSPSGSHASESGDGAVREGASRDVGFVTLVCLVVPVFCLVELVWFAALIYGMFHFSDYVQRLF
jgi:hypothetical protein